MSDVPVLTLTVERPVAGGRSLARHDGQVVLVAGAIPGERVRVRVTRMEKRVLFADVIEVLEASEFRRAPRADAACGGLSLAHVAYGRQVALKAEIVADAFRRIAKIDLPAAVAFTTSPEDAYRWRARLRVRHGRAGFFREGTHDLCDAGPSGQLRSDALAAVGALAVAVANVEPRVEAVTMVENADASVRLACLDVADGEEKASAWPDLDVSGFHGLSVTGRSGQTTLCGPEAVVDTAETLGIAASDVPATVQWQRRPTSFFQANRYLAGPLVDAVLAEVSGARVLDLYAGVGLFAVPLAARGLDVLAVEGDASSGADLRANAGPWASRLTVQVASVELVLDQCRKAVAGTAIVDPPRTGMSPRALQRLIALAVPRVIYVSCDPATLARDAAALAGQGYDVISIRGFDMFPNTPHIETLTVFDRRH